MCTSVPEGEYPVTLSRETLFWETARRSQYREKEVDLLLIMKNSFSKRCGILAILNVSCQCVTCSTVLITTRMNLGLIGKRNGVSFDIACKEYLVKMTYKYKHWLEKEVKCLVKLKHPNVLQHFGWDFERSMLVTELLWREVKLGDGNTEYVHNARQLLNTLAKRHTMDTSIRCRS